MAVNFTLVNPQTALTTTKGALTTVGNHLPTVKNAGALVADTFTSAAKNNKGKFGLIATATAAAIAITVAIANKIHANKSEKAQ